MRETGIAMEGCIKRDLVGHVGEEWIKRATDRINWRLLIENVVREKRKKKTTETEIMVNSPLTIAMPRKRQ